jgi:hypothetical protein
LDHEKINEEADHHQSRHRQNRAPVRGLRFGSNNFVQGGEVGYGELLLQGFVHVHVRVVLVSGSGIVAEDFVQALGVGGGPFLVDQSRE